MPKLTETTNDANKREGQRIPAAQANGGLHIVEAHEPLKTGESPAIPKDFQAFPMQQVVYQQQITANPPTPAQAAEPQPLKVALIGTAPSSRMLAPFSDPSWKIWACSPGNQGVLPRVDVWFELHGNLLWPEHKHYGEPYLKWLSEQKFPIYMQDQSFIPNAISFPKDELIKMFGRRCWTSSFAWMLAFAVYSGAKEVNLYGIDMASRDEYIQQRHGFNGLLDKVEGMGIKVNAPYESDIMMPPGLYGYSEVTPFGRKMAARRKEIKDRLASMEQQRQQIHDNILYLKGADEDIDYTMSIWGGAQDKI